MITDIRPIVERILRQLVLAGLPVIVTGCDDGRTATGDTGVGGGGGASSSCLPVNVTCGTAPSCPPWPVDGGTGFPITPSMKIVDFNRDDPRWAELYRACANSGAAGTCGPDCSGFCAAAMMANATTSLGNNYAHCEVTCDQADKLTIGYINAVCGRRCGGGRPRGRASTLGDHLADAAELEAESVPAFGRLGRGLAANGAPADLVRAARVAMAEEARHWRRTRDLAHRKGGRPVKPKISASPFTSLEELALENITEGCVRETYGAMVAAHQATTARDADIRQLMTEIAADEMGHSALSWKIDAWATARLGPNFRARRTDAALRALGELLSASLHETDVDIAVAAGLPGRDVAHELLAAAWTHVWQPTFSATEPSERTTAT